MSGGCSSTISGMSGDFGVSGRRGCSIMRRRSCNVPAGTRIRDSVGCRADRPRRCTGWADSGHASAVIRYHEQVVSGSSIGDRRIRTEPRLSR